MGSMVPPVQWGEPEPAPYHGGGHIGGMMSHGGGHPGGMVTEQGGDYMRMHNDMDGEGMRNGDPGEMAPQGPPRPLCVSMDEMTAVSFEASSAVSIVVAMLVPVPGLLYLWHIHGTPAGLMFEVLHLSLFIYPLILYNCYLYATAHDEIEHIRWQTELAFPILLYVMTSLLMAGYHSFRNVSQIAARRGKGQPQLAPDEWDGLMRAGEFLEFHGVFDSNSSVTQHDSEDFKLGVLFKIFVLSRLLALAHPFLSPLYYRVTFGSAVLNTAAEEVMIISAAVATHFLVGQVVLTCLKGYVLYRYRLQTVERFARLSSMPLAENPFQLQFPEGLQFWLDARFIMTRHDLQRVWGVALFMGCVAVLLGFSAILLVLEVETGVGLVQYLNWVDKAHILLDFVLLSVLFMIVVGIACSIATHQASHAGILAMKRYELSLLEASGGDINMNKSVALFNQVIEYVRLFDAHPRMLGIEITPHLMLLVGALCSVAVAIACAFFYTTQSSVLPWEEAANMGQ